MDTRITHVPVEVVDEVTQPYRFPTSPGRASLFQSLADALGQDTAATEKLVSELLVYVDATPETLTGEQLWGMRAGLLELAENVLPAPRREGARSRLLVLMLEVAPVDSSGDS
jgi:hypothetical protein